MVLTLEPSPICDIQSFAGLLCFDFEAIAFGAFADLFVIRALARDQLQSLLLLRLSLVQYFTEFCFILFSLESCGNSEWIDNAYRYVKAL